MPIGLIGTGLLGSAMAARFLARGMPVVAWDCDPGALAEVRDLGAIAAKSADEVASRTPVLVLSLPHSGISALVLEEIGQHLLSRALVIDTTTGRPEEMAAFAKRLAARGVLYVDATVGGNSTQVLAGEVIALVGGEANAFQQARSVLDTFARRVFHLGQAGAGARMKLVLNLALGLNRAVMAEALRFAAASGCDPALALEILKEGPAYSRVMDIKGERMLRRHYPAEARLSQHLKDVRLILEEGERLGAPLPLSAVHRELLEAAEALGFGHSDNSAVLEAYYGKTK
ncbi:MAG: NAD(P)-dependent oxidoreductase [Acidobacteria bacterium]|nr:NAD(P)-dependent oxidoreductase [Acidobacteriota bacterium]